MRFVTKFAIAIIGWNFLPPAEATAASAQPAAEAAPIPLLSKQTSAECIFVAEELIRFGLRNNSTAESEKGSRARFLKGNR